MSEKQKRPKRRRRRRKSQTEKTVDDVTGFIEDNPVASAVAALAAGAVVASVFKIAMPNAQGDDEELEPEDAG